MSLNTAVLKEKTDLTHDVFQLKFQPLEHIEFLAGQFVTIKITDKEDSPCFRAYSIASAPEEKDFFELCVKIVEDGRGTNWLNSLQTGDKIEFLGPHGKFLYDEQSNKNALFIATGTGIAPLKSMIEDQLAKGNNKNLQLLFGLRHIKDVFYQDLLEDLGAKYPNFEYKITLSQPENENWSGETGRVTEILEKTDLDTKNTEVYLCGLKAMIESVTTILKDKGFSDDAINFEKYD